MVLQKPSTKIMIAKSLSTRSIKNINHQYPMALWTYVGWILGLNPPAIVMKVVVEDILEMLSWQT